MIAPLSRMAVVAWAVSAAVVIARPPSPREARGTGEEWRHACRALLAQERAPQSPASHTARDSRRTASGSVPAWHPRPRYGFGRGCAARGARPRPGRRRKPVPTSTDARRGADRPAARPGESCFRRLGSGARHVRPRDRAPAARRATPRGGGSRSCRADRSFSAPCSAAGPILQNYALGFQLVANAIGGGEVAILL